jgi:membrane associated rhomboid family serine protease
MPLRINVPALTRVLLVALLALSFLNGAIRYTQWSRSRGDSSVSGVQVPYLTLVPQSAIFYPWVFLTTTLVEPNIFALVVTAVTILYGGKYLERAWGSVELAKFLLLVTLPSNIIAWATYLIGQSMVNEKLKL